MSDLNGTPGELRATIQITRKATGKVETYELIGRAEPAPPPKETAPPPPVPPTEEEIRESWRRMREDSARQHELDVENGEYGY